MAYVHCHNCGWDNGDFESTKTHISLVKFGIVELIKLTWLKQGLSFEYQGGVFARLRIFLCCSWNDVKGLFKSFFQTYKTMDEFKKKNPSWECPSCGKRGLDID